MAHEDDRGHQGSLHDRDTPGVEHGRGPYFGHETEAATALTKRVVRQGKVDVGTPTVVEPAKM